MESMGASVCVAVVWIMYEVLCRGVECCAEDTRVGRDGGTILHIAAQLGDTKTVDFLMRHEFEAIGVLY